MARPQNIQKEAILATAKPMFFKNGIHATEMKDIAAACSIGRSSLYRYFDSKESLAFALAELALQELFSALERGTQCGGNGYARVENGLLRFADAMKAHPELLRFLDDFDCYFSDAYPNTESAERYMRNMKGEISFLTAALRDGAADGSIHALENPTFTCQYLINLMLAAGQRILPRAKLLRSEQGYAEEYFDTTVQLLLHSLIA